MNIAALAGAAVTVCLLALTVRQLKPEYGTAVTAAAGVVMLAVIMNSLVPVISEISKIVSDTSAVGYLKPVLKAFGVCLITQAAADICRDAGQLTVAGHVETAGRLVMVIIALPMLSSVMTTASGIING